MKKIILIGVGICLCLQAFCQSNEKGFTIHGSIAGDCEGMKVFLFDEATRLAIDSTVIKSGVFLFRGQVKMPATYKIMIDRAGNNQKENFLSSRFYLENSEITYAGHVDSLETYYWASGRKAPLVKGSATQDLLEDYRSLTKTVSDRIQQLNEEYLEVYHRPTLKGKFNTTEGIRLTREIQKYRQEKNQITRTFIENHPSTVVAYDLARQFLSGMYIDLTVEQIKNLTDIISEAWDAYPLKVTEFQELASKAESMALGGIYPDVELVNSEGKKVKLSEYVPDGKYVMLEFWASWCGPCRAEIPHLRHIYETYKDKGFVIVSISIDKKKEDWEKAVREEKMEWSQLRAEKGFQDPAAKEFRILGVPTCIMLDPEGRIFKTGMRGAYLDAALQDLFGVVQ